MPKAGFRFSAESRARMSRAHKGRKPWNTGTGGCRRGHDAKLYHKLPGGVAVCLGCKRENGAKYRRRNRDKIALTGRAANYGLTVAGIDAMLAAQDNKCLICGVEFTYDASKPKRWSWRVDHDHATGKVRGLLCHPCNTALGLFKDSPDIIAGALRYLKSST